MTPHRAVVSESSGPPRELPQESSVVALRNLLREGGRHEVIHLWKADRVTECGLQFRSIVGTWMDDDRKVTCPKCQAVRDGHHSPPTHNAG